MRSKIHYYIIIVYSFRILRLMRLSLNRYKVDKLGENDTGLRKVLPSQLFKSPRVQATNSAPAVRADVIQ